MGHGADAFGETGKTRALVKGAPGWGEQDVEQAIKKAKLWCAERAAARGLS